MPTNSDVYYIQLQLKKIEQELETKPLQDIIAKLERQIANKITLLELIILSFSNQKDKNWKTFYRFNSSNNPLNKYILG